MIAKCGTFLTIATRKTRLHIVQGFLSKKNLRRNILKLLRLHNDIIGALPSKVEHHKHNMVVEEGRIHLKLIDYFFVGTFVQLPGTRTEWQKILKFLVSRYRVSFFSP